MLIGLRQEMQLLSVADIFESLSEEELEQLARQNPDVRLREGDLLFAPGEIAERLYVVKEGRIRLYLTSPEGAEVTLVFAEEGQIFGEMALTAQRLREVYAQAVEPSLLLSLSRQALEDLILKKPRVGLRLAERLSERVRRLENRLENLAFKEVPARLASLILQLVEDEGVRTGEGYYEIPTHYTHEQLAAMISANRVSVSRALGKLRESGVVEQREHLILVKDLQALGSAAREERRAQRAAEEEQID